MSIDPTLPDRLAQEAAATGGLVRPLQGNDVLKEQIDLDVPRDQKPNPEEGEEVAGLGKIISDVARPVVEPVTEAVRRGVGRVLSPGQNTLNRAADRAIELQEEQAAQRAAQEAALEADPESTIRDMALDALQEADAQPIDPTVPQQNIPPLEMTDVENAEADRLLLDAATSVPEQERLGFGRTFDEENELAYSNFENGNQFEVNDETYKNVLADLKKPAQISPDGLLSDFRATSRQGDARIPDEEGVLSGIQAISKAYSSQIDAAKRGKIENEATRQVADLLGMAPNKLKRRVQRRTTGGVIQVEGFGLAESMLAARDLLVNELKVLDRLAKKAEFGDDLENLQFRQQMQLVAELQANIKGSQTEIARALQAFRIPARSGQGDTEMMRAKDVVALLDEYGGVGDIKSLAALYNSGAKTVHQKAALAKIGSRFKRISDAFYEAWVNLLLSNPITHIKNTVGAFLTTGMDIPETALAAGIGSTRRALGGTGGTYMFQTNAQVFGAMMGLRDAFSGAGRAFRTGERPIAGSKLEGVKGNRPVNAFTAEAMGINVFARTVDVLGKFMTMGRIPTGLLEFEDTLFKVVAQRMSLYETAFSTGKAVGLKGDALIEHIAEYVVEPPETAIREADAHAKYITLQKDLDPDVGKKLAAVRAIPVIRYFVPFFKTPYNSFKYIFRDRSLLGVASPEIRQTIAKGFKSGATQLDKQAAEKAVSRQLLGLAAAGVTYSLALEGSITGSGPNDPGMRENLRKQGWRPYSVRIPGTITDELPKGVHVSLTAFEPFSTIFMVAGDSAELSMYGDLSDEDRLAMVTNVATLFSNQLTEKQFLSGFSDLVSTMQDPQRYANSTIQGFQRTVVPRAVANLKKTGAVPFGENIAEYLDVTEGSVADAILTGDPQVRNAATFLEQIRSQVPGWSSTLPPRRDHFGEIRLLDNAIGGDLFSPLYSSEIGENDLAKDAKAFRRRTTKVSKVFEALNYSPPMPGDVLQFRKVFNNPPSVYKFKGVQMTAEEQSEYQKLSGKYALENVEKFLRAVRTSKTFREAEKGNDLFQQEIKTRLAAQFQQARERAQKEMYRKNSSLRDRFTKALEEAQRNQRQMRR